jgi:tetratricopeptide (TPR) repeat protein
MKEYCNTYPVPHSDSHQQGLESAVRLLHMGLLQEAEDLLRRIVREDRGHADGWNLLGIALQRQDKIQESIEVLQTAIDIAPRSPEILVNLGNTYKESGQQSQAVRLYRRALGLAPGHLMANVNLANTLADSGELDLAEQHARKAIEVDGQAIEALGALANVAEHRRDFAQAIAILEAATKLHPDSPDLLVKLGCTFILAKHFDSAIDVLQRALRYRPGFAEAMNNLGHALFELGRLEEAEQVLLDVVNNRPNMKEAFINLANVYVNQRRHLDALASFGRVFELDPDNASAHFVCGMVYLVEGDFEKGWREYAWRWEMDKYRQMVSGYSVAVWGGEGLNGRTLFVHAEQGIGDTLQFVRYLPLIDKNAGKVIFEVQAPLKRLLTCLDGVDEVLAQGAAIPSMDLRVPLLNLPAVMKTGLGSIPAGIPYLKADRSMVATWHDRLDHLGRDLKVGIAWAGNPEHANDFNRSMLLTALAPLGEIGGICWISLQKGMGRDQMIENPQVLPLIDWTEELTDFADTAALIENLDLVLAVDTSVVHLAGALGKRVWTMIPYAPDWRWLLDRLDTPWYPTMRLFRQQSRGDWSSVVEAVFHELNLLVKIPNSLHN